MGVEQGGSQHLQITESERQLQDVAGIIAVRGEALDLVYIRHWAQELGVLDLWETLLQQVGLQ